MRYIDVKDIKCTVKDLCIKACTDLNKDMLDALRKAIDDEESEAGKAVLQQLIENANIAENDRIPLCQDTGFTVIFLEIGEQVHFTGGSLKDNINEGVSSGYREGYLRKSIIKNPITAPENTKDNTPAIIHYDIVPGDKLKITVFPKGGGSENMSRISMMKPSDGLSGIRNFVIDTVKNAGANPCPPIIVGVGIGGTFDYVAYLAKKALMRPVGQRNPDNKISELEIELLNTINDLGIGPAGLGGRITALDLFIEVHPRHIASFPVAVNIQCHAARCKSEEL